MYVRGKYHFCAFVYHARSSCQVPLLCGTGYNVKLLTLGVISCVPASIRIMQSWIELHTWNSVCVCVYIIFCCESWGTQNVLWIILDYASAFRFCNLNLVASPTQTPQVVACYFMRKWTNEIITYDLGLVAALGIDHCRQSIYCLRIKKLTLLWYRLVSVSKSWRSVSCM